MTDKKLDKKGLMTKEELDKVIGGCNPDYVTGKYDPNAANAANGIIPKGPTESSGHPRPVFPGWSVGYFHPEACI